MNIISSGKENRQELLLVEKLSGLLDILVDGFTISSYPGNLEQDYEDTVGQAIRFYEEELGN